MPIVYIIITLLIAVNIIVSYRGLKDFYFMDKYAFVVEKVLVHKEYYRIITGGFLHVSWMHLIFNMYTLYVFGESLGLVLGPLPFLIVYFAGLVGGDLLALFIHRFHGDYSAVGASGAINGIMFASIAIFPGMDVGMFFLPIGIPGWVYGLVFSLYSIYGIRSKNNNVGHEAHLGGALVGMLVGLIFYPSALADNALTIAIISLPSIIFIYVIVKRPTLLMVDSLYYNQHMNTTIDDRYNIDKRERQIEIDAILEKIHRKGINSLSKVEREKLDEYSKTS